MVKNLCDDESRGQLGISTLENTSCLNLLPDSFDLCSYTPSTNKQHFSFPTPTVCRGGSYFQSLSVISFPTCVFRLSLSVVEVHSRLQIRLHPPQVLCISKTLCSKHLHKRQGQSFSFLFGISDCIFSTVIGLNEVALVTVGKHVYTTRSEVNVARHHTYKFSTLFTFVHV